MQAFVFLIFLQPIASVLCVVWFHCFHSLPTVCHTAISCEITLGFTVFTSLYISVFL
ncbi:membrane protein [gut metagenome]|uniref:Membrane protein n=1 Tax=gut metagenome TaxID=749906 RepID=J9G0J9_9ZZZZ